MKLYDKVKFTSNQISKELLDELNKRNIKVVKNNLLQSEYSERKTLNIHLLNNKIFVNNKELTKDELFDKYRFVSNIYSMNSDDYIFNYSKKVKDRLEKASKKKSSYKYNYNIDNTIGAIYISDEDYYLMEDDDLKRIVFESDDEKYKYVIPNENGYLLRGANTYYYLLSNKGKFSTVESKHFKELYDYYQEYFKSIIKFISKTNNNILILSILDNVRNYLLVLINIETIINQIEDETMLYEYDNNVILDLIYNTYSLIVDIHEKDKINIMKVEELIIKVLKINILNELDNYSKYYNKMLKSHRECDNFLENYICSKDFYEDNKDERNYISMVYGGIEIPLIYYYLTNKKSKVMYLSLFGIYKDRHKKILDYNAKNFELNKVLKHNISHCVLCDDNTMTCKTLQYAIDTLMLNGIETNKIFLINFVALNRIYQMLDNKSLLDLNLIDKYIFGLYYPTKYSKIKFNTNISNSYLDEFEQFDLSKNYICYYLYKNGIYTKESRINNYRIEGIM